MRILVVLTRSYMTNLQLQMIIKNSKKKKTYRRNERLRIISQKSRLGDLVEKTQGRKLSSDFVYWRLCSHQRPKIPDRQEAPGQCECFFLSHLTKYWGLFCVVRTGS